MKFNSSTGYGLALNNAVAISLFSLILFVLFAYVASIQVDIWMYVPGTLLLFMFSFVIIEYTVTRFISEKIRVIYKTIRTSKLPRDTDKSFKRSSLDAVNKEVLEWSENKKKEIEELKNMARYRREFLGNVSHELKTPIFNIQGYVLTLLDGGINDPAINVDYLHRTEKSINRMISLVEDLEKISQLESGELQMQMTRFDIVSLTREVIEFMEIKSNQKKTKIYFSQSYDKPYLVFADKERIKEVLINLIDNAIKYGQPNDPKIKVSFFEMDTNILVEVADNGPGMESSDLNRIFERFYRIDKDRSREKGGSGLGLAIVKHIIEAHDETVNVRSTKGVGTTFGFTLKKA